MEPISKKNDNLPFLDVLVKHEQTGFSTSLYRKKTFTGLYTDYASVAPGTQGTKSPKMLKNMSKIIQIITDFNKNCRLIMSMKHLPL